MRHNQTRTHLHQKCVYVAILNQPSKNTISGWSLNHKQYVKLLATIPAVFHFTRTAKSLHTTVGVIVIAIFFITAALILPGPAQNVSRRSIQHGSNQV